MTKQFLIIHGWGGSPEGHWQHWLVDELRKRGEKVSFPILPHAHKPKRDEWLHTLGEIVSGFDEQDDLIVIAHSLGPVAWMHFERAHPELSAKRVYFVAPAPYDPGYNEIRDFYPVRFTPHDETKYIVIASDNDEYTPIQKVKKFFNGMDVELRILTGQGHINTAAGYGEWPWILDECLI